MTSSRPRVFFVFPPKGSLAELERNGQLGRFLDNYVSAYANAGFDVGLVTFGERERERTLIAGAPIATLIAPRSSAGWLWAAAAPLAHARAARGVDLWRPLQAPGLLTAAIAKFAFRSRILVTYGYDYVDFSMSAGHDVRARLLRLLLRYALPFADQVVVTSDAIARRAVNAGALPQSLIVVPNAAPVAEIRSTVREPRTVAWIGRLVAQKRFDIALRAAEIAGARLWVVGEGLLTQADTDRLKRIGGRHFGPLPHTQVLDLLDRSEAFLLSSDYEGTPKVLLEALARGTASVASNLPELRWLTAVSPQVVRTFSKGDAESAGAVLNDLLNNKAELELLGVAGHRLAQEQFDLSVTLAKEVSHARILAMRKCS